MVRKRAHAEKALTPPTEMPNRKTTRRNSRTTDTINETPAKKVKDEHPESPTNDNGNSVKERLEVDADYNGIKQTENNIAPSGSEIDHHVAEEIEECFDELPDCDTIEKGMNNKTKSYWNAVKNDYHDFSNWTCLLQSVTEVEDNIEAARYAYNCFLRYYPYCYGYWKKFADIERKTGNLEQAKQVFERGVAAIPICIDLWVHYLNFSMQRNKGNDNEREIRDLFNRAINAAGLEFKSNKLWDAYIEWEKSLGHLKNVTEIFDKLIATPTQQHVKSWQKFKAHLESNSPVDVIPAKDYGRLVKEIDSLPPGMTVDDDTETSSEHRKDDTTDVINVDSADDETMKETYEKMRNRILMERNTLFRETGNEIEKRLQFEEAIKRPYFHVKPLEKSQIKNWKEYLDFEMKLGNHKRIVFLFERCIVVCALYESFWIKYLDYVEEKDPMIARTVFSRACDIHMIKKYKIHLRWATFEEKQKDYNKAASILSKIDKNFPGLIMITQKRVGVARRMNKLDDAISIYEAAIHNVEMIEDKIFFSIKLAHILAKFCNKKSQARNVLWSALQLGKKHKRLYLQILDLELHYGAVESDHTNKLFSAVENDMNVDREFRDCFAQRKVEFYQEYGDDIDEIIAVQNSYKKQHEKVDSYNSAERLSKEAPSKRKQSYDGSKSKNDKTSENLHHQQQQQQQQQYQEPPQWQPPPPDGANYYGWYAQQYANYNQEQ